MARNTPQSAPSRMRDVDPIWSQLAAEAEALVVAEPDMAGFVHATILNKNALEHAVIHRLAQRLESPEFDAITLFGCFTEVLDRAPEIGDLMRRDLVAVYDRDPVCARIIEPVLYFKGFQGLQAHRISHHLWHAGRKDFALMLQSQVSKLFAMDIHPATRIGPGVMIDHASGIVFGETAVIGEDCSILHDVTLGGTGKEPGDRHPKVGRCVLIAAGAKILGNITIGDCSRIAAGSVVLQDIPANKTAAGIPARIVGDAGCPEPSRSMDQLIPDA